MGLLDRVSRWHAERVLRRMIEFAQEYGVEVLALRLVDGGLLVNREVTDGTDTIVVRLPSGEDLFTLSVRPISAE